ncbi:MAG: ABC transporter ATP-binding protein [Opitutales bacterium]
MAETFTGEHLLSIRNLTKRYGDLVAVNDVSLNIRPGEIFALLGANGAGKTTLIGCTTGLISRFEGEIRVAGYDVKRDYRTARQLVGLVPQELNFDGFFRTGELLRYQGGYFGAAAGVVRQRREHLLQSFALKEKEEANTRRLSGGMKRRLMICKALMHEPVLLFLDEPTAGVDVELREELWNYIRGLRNEGTTIVLTTHYLEEAEQLADRIGIINRGRLLRVDAREDLMRAFGRRWIEVRLSGPAPGALLDKLKDLRPEQTAPNRLKITIKEKQTADREEANSLFALMKALREEKMTIETVESGRSRLEDIFKEVVKQDYRNGDGRNEP